MSVPETGPAAKAPDAPPPAAAKVAGVEHSREPVWSLRKALPRRYRIPFALAMPVILTVLWCAFTLGKNPVIKPLYVASPIEVIRATLGMIFEHTLFADIWASTVRIVIAFVAAAIVALPLGIAMGAFEPINRLMEPIMAPLRYLPISAFIPLFILWFSIGETQKIAFLFLGVFVYLLPVVVTAIRQVPEELVQTALTLGATRWQVIRTVLVPAALPDIFDSFRVMNAIAWTYVVLAEMVNAHEGIGHMIQEQGNLFHTPKVFSGIIAVGLIGLITDALIRGLNALLFRWRGDEQAT
jgi:NitT/TauT family transport system permease protein